MRCPPVPEVQEQPAPAAGRAWLLAASLVRGGRDPEAQTGAGLSALSGLDAALARQDAAQQQREAAVRDLRERLSVDCNEWQFAQERLDNARRASAVASEVHASYTRQYTAGKKGWLDVLNAVRESTQSDMAAANASAQASAAALRLQVLGGNLKGLFE